MGNFHFYQIPWVISAAEVQDLHLRELYPIILELWLGSQRGREYLFPKSDDTYFTVWNTTVAALVPSALAQHNNNSSPFWRDSQPSSHLGMAQTTGVSSQQVTSTSSAKKLARSQGHSRVPLLHLSPNNAYWWVVNFGEVFSHDLRTRIKQYFGFII